MVSRKDRSCSGQNFALGQFCEKTKAKKKEDILAIVDLQKTYD